ncbi:MAG: FeoB-associated Cys-rich membrane protein [Lachnospiraceae bacterium]|nr:FeoB-associated Cys-rich membrane protein [Lachnospiraceae bacterium]
MDDLILVAVLVLIIGAAVVYIIKEKKRGVKCIGCPAAAECASRNSGAVSACSGCGGCGAGESKCSGNCAGCHAGKE